MDQLWLWIGFNVFVLLLLALDLGVFHRRSHVIEIREALLWSAFWIALSLTFNLGVYFWRGSDTALEFLAGYLIEKSLSVDNIFVFLMIFSYFGVSPVYQHKVLFWGILGALIMRGVFIATGVTLIQKFHWIIYIFGVFLIITGFRIATQKTKEIRPGRNPVLRGFRRLMPILDDYEKGKFFARREGRLFATPLLVVLLFIETTDVVFALDSIPAILAITLDPFIVYTSNVFAILGLRALYFALAGIMRLFHYLHHGIAAILVFVGIKMILGNFYEVPVGVALGVIAGILLVSVVVSIVRPPKGETVLPPGEQPLGQEKEMTEASRSRQ